MIALASAGRAIRRGEQRRDLARVEECHGPLDIALAGHRQYQLTVQTARRARSWRRNGRTTDGGEARITAARAVTPGRLNVQQEVADQGRHPGLR